MASKGDRHIQGLSQMNSLESFLNFSKRLGNLGASLKNMRDSIAELTNSGSSSGALYIYNQNKESIAELERFDKDAYSELLELKGVLMESATESALAFPIDFPREIESLAIEFCEGSRSPLYLFDRRFIEVRFNAKELFTQIKTRGGREQIIGVEAEIVSGAIKNHIARLHNRKLDSSELQRRVLEVFQSVQLGDKENDSKSIRIKDFIKSYQKAYKCPPDEAIVDLSEAYKLFSNIKLDFTKDYEQGFLLYGFEERGYFGFISVED